MGFFRAVLFSLTLVFSFVADAAITIINVEGASHITGIGPSKKEGESPNIYGGTAGDPCTDGGSNTSTCNNCANHAFNQACNVNRVYGALRLRIQFRSDTVDGRPGLGNADGSQNSGLVIEPGTSTGVLPKGNTHTVTVLWSNICNSLLSIGPDCTGGNKTVNLSIGVDKNGDGNISGSEDDRTTVPITVQNTIQDVAKSCDDSTIESGHGICGFEVFPGDQKVFMHALAAPSTFPQGDGISYNRIRVYFAEASGFSAINHTSSNFEMTIEKKDDGTIEASPDIVDGLTNGTEYFFRMATVDLAGNVGYHTPELKSDGSAFHVQGTHSATPSPVSALLNDNFQCFIATAAFGSPLEENVALLREFRDRFLKPSSVGRWFVETYYRLSPPLAEAIAHRPWARKAARIGLFPAVFLAQATLQWGAGPVFSILMLTIFGSIAAVFFWRRRGTRYAA